MSNQSLMQTLLGEEQWQALPLALQAHYQHGENTDKGTLDIEYPRFMQPYLTLMHLFGALINQRGKAIPTTVAKWVENDRYYWHRRLHFPDGKTVVFNSHWVHAGGNELIEYVNRFIGIRMAVSLQDEQLHYAGKHYVIKLGRWLLPLPEWLILGHTTIVETALNDEDFAMDFRLQHPLLGRVFRYAGTFCTEST